MKEELIKLAIEKGFISAEVLFYQIEDEWEEEMAYYLLLTIIQRWLREEYGVDVNILARFQKPKRKEYKISVYLKDSVLAEGFKLSKTYEEALEKGLF